MAIASGELTDVYWLSLGRLRAIAPFALICFWIAGTTVLGIDSMMRWLGGIPKVRVMHVESRLLPFLPFIILRHSGFGVLLSRR
ncbi:MAG: hypothetical protein KGI47_09485 [Betaproteobacteria bacterium]|nr:hypothetical protein [Betaproteobacteria bacterium]MDE2621858.1 hypothetical protein [Betaproteobacteria bacterium]